MKSEKNYSVSTISFVLILFSQILKCNGEFRKFLINFVTKNILCEFKNVILTLMKKDLMIHIEKKNSLRLEQKISKKDLTTKIHSTDLS